MPVYETVGGRVTLHRRHAEALDRSDALAGFDSTTVNLYKLASSGLDLRPERTVLLGFAPLYSRFVDVWDTVDRLTPLVETGEYRQVTAEPARVT
jgi:hypothetical protein